jgi:hypothetical protein
MTDDPIRCRAQLHPDCYDGCVDEDIYGGDSWRTDGTYLDETIVCDPCYIDLGQPVNGPELENAIAARRGAR